MFKKRYISQSDQAVIELGNRDPLMKKLIKIIGDLEVETRPDFFESLIRSIIGQQISVQAANSIYLRLLQLTDNQLTVDKLAEMTPEELRSVGLSKPKIKYIRDLTQKVYSGDLDLKGLTRLDNETVVKELTKVKGIGDWTADVFLIFSLERMNVLAIDDIGLQRGAKWLYQVDQSERRDILIKKEPIWHPHLTLASFYLWEAVLLNFINDYQSIDKMNH